MKNPPDSAGGVSYALLSRQLGEQDRIVVMMTVDG
jgi:hypothetical protein